MCRPALSNYSPLAAETAVGGQLITCSLSQVQQSWDIWPGPSWTSQFHKIDCLQGLQTLKKKQFRFKHSVKIVQQNVKLLCAETPL